MITNTSQSSKDFDNLEEKVAAKRNGRNGIRGPRIKAGSGEAKRVAAAILEVLGGIRMPTDAATALGVSLPRYYHLESRALSGFLSACEPRPIGRVRSTESELALAQKEVNRLQKECARYSALVRVAQRTVGLAAPQLPKPNAKGSGKKRRKKATVRALKAVEVLQSGVSGEAEAGSAGEQPAKE
jgi:hypothetical protein